MPYWGGANGNICQMFKIVSQNIVHSSIISTTLGHIVDTRQPILDALKNRNTTEIPLHRFRIVVCVNVELKEQFGDR